MASYFYTEAEPHFLEACFLCRRPLGFNSDIFMYRGDTPFCSKECREEQIEMDEAHEKSKKTQIKTSSSSSHRNESVRPTALVDVSS